MPARPLPAPRRVALLVESSRAYGRGLLRGIARYAHQHGAWSMVFTEGMLDDSPPSWLAGLAADGVLARIDDRVTAAAVRGAGVPAVDLRGRFADLGLPLVETDDEAVASMAFEHLAERGFTRLAFCGLGGTNFSAKRRDHFLDHARRAGRTCQVLDAPTGPADARTPMQERRGLEDVAALGRWLRALPKPVGVMACNDVRAQQVLAVCRRLGLAVPDEVAVLGVDDDDVLCELCDPPLSSVAPDAQRIGYEAARLLEAMMTPAGAEAPPAKLFLPPLGVVARRSTDVLAVDDPVVARALRLARAGACQGMQVADLVAALHVSRSALERRFTRALGRTPKGELLRVQLGRVRELLRATDLPLAEIAERAGFQHPEYLSAIFRKKTGETPGQYRRTHRPEPPASLERPRALTSD